MNNITWQPASVKSDLTSNTIHIWQIPLNASVSDINVGLALLDAQERERAFHYRFKHQFRRFIIAHAGLRKVLALYTHQLPQSLKFVLQTYKKPVLIDYPGIHFNLSHSEELAICAIALFEPVGVDIEFHKPLDNYIDIAKHIFSENEIEQLENLSALQQLQGFYNAWTRKEAFIKAIGQGIYYPLNKFSVSLHPEKIAQVLSIDIAPAQTSEWELHEFKPEANYTAALAIRRQCNHYSYFLMQ